MILAVFPPFCFQVFLSIRFLGYLYTCSLFSVYLTVELNYIPSLLHNY